MLGDLYGSYDESTLLIGVTTVGGVSISVDSADGTFGDTNDDDLGDNADDFDDNDNDCFNGDDDNNEDAACKFGLIFSSQANRFSILLTISYTRYKLYILIYKDWIDTNGYIKQPTAS